MGAKATFDAVNKLITLTAVPVGGLVTVDAQVDLYSDAKEDWRRAATLNRFTFPFEVFGGNDLGNSLAAGAFFILRNDLGWRIRPFEADHEVTVLKNLYPKEPAQPIFVPTLGDFTVAVQLERSSLTLVNQTGVSGLTAAESADLALTRKLQSNGATVSQDGLTATIFDDDGVTPLLVFDVTPDQRTRTPQP